MDSVRYTKDIAGLMCSVLSSEFTHSNQESLIEDDRDYIDHPNDLTVVESVGSEEDRLTTTDISSVSHNGGDEGYNINVGGLNDTQRKASFN